MMYSQGGIVKGVSAGTIINSMSMEKNGTGIDPLTGLKDRSVLPYLNEQFSFR